MATVGARSPVAALACSIPAKFRQMARDAGRDPQSVPITLFNPAEDEGELARYRDMGIARVVPMLLSEERDKILPVLDRWAVLIHQTAH